MKKWLTFFWLTLCVLGGENSRDHELALLPGKMLNIIPDFLEQSPRTTVAASEGTSSEILEFQSVDVARGQISSTTDDGENSTMDTYTTDETPYPLDSRYPVLHAGLPRGLSVTPLPLANGDHELAFNVTWLPSLGPPARDYSLEVISETNTEDCRSPICYEYDIPGESQWHLIPRVTTPVAEACAVRPGCTYRVRLIAHPWDGHSHANLHVQLDECVAGVCSCAHAPRLPAPSVQAQMVTLDGAAAVNVTWSLPIPRRPQRLPPTLRTHYYFVSIGKQMVSDAHPSPWFAHTISRQVPSDVLVAHGEGIRWTVLRVKRSGERGDERRALDVKLLARVSVVDDRGCIGPAGNATAYDPAEAHKIRIGTYVLWASLGGACVLAMVALLAVSARIVKRVLNAFRPAAVSAPLEPPRRRPAWFPLQLRT